MIVAGIGCRRGCGADEIVALVRRAEAMCRPVEALAAPAFKSGEPGLHLAAAALGVALHFVPAATMQAAQPLCATSSAAARAATGFASIAEAAAIGVDGRLILPRIASARATCAIAEHT